MTFRGFLVFHDPPKADAQRTIHDLSRLGIRIKVISGDNRHVTAHLAEAVGLDAKSMLTGEELATLKDEALWHLAPRTDLFVEIDPQQKERIVRALQRTGHSVGYLGDGINDAPALHAADVGISVEEAVDVARESADIILLRRDLDVLRTGVEDGRRTFANTLKYISITTSANFGNMISMALATPLLPFLPLAAKQILLNNFLSDVPSIAISSDNVDPERVLRPQRWNVKDIQKFMIVFGLISSVFDLLTFGVLLLVFHANEATFQTSWFMISLLTELAVVLVLRTHKPAFRSKPSRLLLWSTLAVVIATFAIPFLGRLTSVFGFVPLSATLLAAIVVDRARIHPGHGSGEGVVLPTGDLNLSVAPPASSTHRRAVPTRRLRSRIQSSWGGSTGLVKRISLVPGFSSRPRQDWIADSDEAGRVFRRSRPAFRHEAGHFERSSQVRVMVPYGPWHYLGPAGGVARRRFSISLARSRSFGAIRASRSAYSNAMAASSALLLKLMRACNASRSSGRRARLSLRITIASAARPAECSPTAYTYGYLGGSGASSAALSAFGAARRRVLRRCGTDRPGRLFTQAAFGRCLCSPAHQLRLASVATLTGTPSVSEIEGVRKRSRRACGPDHTNGPRRCRVRPLTFADCL